jgi:hypothetical protein
MYCRDRHENRWEDRVPKALAAESRLWRAEKERRDAISRSTEALEKDSSASLSRLPWAGFRRNSEFCTVPPSCHLSTNIY